VARQVGGQVSSGGEAAHGPPHVSGEQSSASRGGEQHRVARQADPPGQVGIDPGRGRAGQRQALASVAAGDPHPPVPAVGAEVGDVGADDLAEAGAGEQQDSDQRGGAGMLRSGLGIGRVDERKGLAGGQARCGRGAGCGGTGPG
jgi:hypothetical protein